MSNFKNNNFAFNHIDNQKTLSIPIKTNPINPSNSAPRSWNGYSERLYKPVNFLSSPSSPTDAYKNRYNRRDFSHNYNPRKSRPSSANTSPANSKTNSNGSSGRESMSTSPHIWYNELTEQFETEYKHYNAIENCKSAGVIPYSIHNGKILFLFQKELEPQRKKDSGLNDFGGKRVTDVETTAEAAAREFSEETSCLFYLVDTNDNSGAYDILKDNPDLVYDETAIDTLKRLIPLSQKYYHEKITEYASPIYISSKEIYISYFIRVPYIPDTDLPRAEDIHVPYDDRYIRECKWFTAEEVLQMNEKDFHKRLQITKIQKRIHNCCKKGLFI